MPLASSVQLVQWIRMATSEQGSMSPLVSCLEQLGDDAWCNALLPLLVKAKVAGALALTCSQLRAICQRCTKQLNLTQLSACSSTAQVESWTAHLPDRFSNCTHIKLAFSEADHYVNIPALLPALARLQALQSLSLVNPSTTPALGAALVLDATRRQLPQLRALDLQVPAACSAACVWRAVSDMSQLTGLAVRVGAPGPGQSHDLQHTSALRGLSELRSLDLSASSPSEAALAAGVDLRSGGGEFLADMPQLTKLTLKMSAVLIMNGLGSCSSLQNLQLFCGTPPFEVAEPHWAALGSLVHLTSLHIGYGMRQVMSSGFYGALQQLVQLQSVFVGVWSWEALPALARLTCLRELHGVRWLEPQDVFPNAPPCPSVQHFVGSGHIPTGALSGVTFVALLGSVPPSVLPKLAVHCTNLTRLGLARLNTLPERTWSSLDPAAPAWERVAAIRSLANISGLRKLEFSVHDNLEVVALADLAQVGVPLSSLEVHVWPGSQATAMWLVQLASAAVPVLRLLLNGLKVESAEAACMLVCGFKRRFVTVFVPSLSQVRVWQQAQQWVQEAGLAAPHQLSVQLI